MVLRIKRRSQAEWLVMYVFALPFALSLLLDLLHFPSVIKYTIDFALVVLMLIAYLNKKNVRDPQVADVMRVVLVFALVTVIGQVLEYQSVIYYLWGIRNYFRFFIFFLMCTMMLKRDDADAGMRLLDGLFYINFAVVLIQVLVLNAHQDRVGGIFGSSRGCNAYNNIYLMIIVAWYMLRYMSKKESLLKLVSRCGISLLIAAVSELKMFFLEFALITLMATLMTRFSTRKFIVIILAAIGFMAGIRIIQIMFPFFADWFDLKVIIESASSKKGYTYVNDINRLSAITISWNRFLDTWPRKLFGLGLGNCDYSSNFDFLTSPFYEKYGRMHYSWFSSSFLILETGLIGLAVYICFFLRVYRAAKSVEKKEPENLLCCQLARIMAIMALVLIIYNSSLRMECAYMLYFVLALPFVRQLPRDKDIKLHAMQRTENGGIQ